MKHFLNIAALILYCGLIGAQEYKISRVNLGDRGTSRICPVLYGDGIVYMSNKRVQVLKTVRDVTGQLPYNLYMRKITGKKVEEEEQAFANGLRTNFNDGPVCFSADGKTMYYSRNIELGHIGDTGTPRTLGIFISTKMNEEKWSEPEAFDFNSGNYNVSHPAIHPSGQVLVFSSTKPGGAGGADLYYCTRNNEGGWSEPQNMGESVNTASDEVFPAFNSLGDRLFYSTDGKEGFGGLDIWKVSYDHQENDFKHAVILPSGINSPKDDFGITSDSTGMTGYFGSNRNGGDEIFFFERLMPSFKNCAANPEVNFCYLVQENNILEGEDLPLKFHWNMGDGQQRQGRAVAYCYADTGRYNAVLNIVDTTSGEVYYEVSSVLIDIRYPESNMILFPDSVEVGSSQIVKAFKGNASQGVLDTYWQIDGGSISVAEEYRPVFNETGKHVIRLGVLDESGVHSCVSKTVHVVDAGTLMNGNTLSTHGPTRDHESKEFAVELLNSIRRKALTDPVFEQVNYPITERFDEIDSVYQYTVGESDKVASLYHLYREMKDIGFESRVVSFESNEITVKGVNEVLVFFSQGKDDITPHNEANLNEFVNQLKEPYSLEVLGYADPTGNKEFNKQLSLNRAKSVAEFLESKGVKRKFITVKALGAVEEPTFDESVLKFYRKVEVKLLSR